MQVSHTFDELTSLHVALTNHSESDEQAALSRAFEKVVSFLCDRQFDDCQVFIDKFIELGLIDLTAKLIESGSISVATTACSALGNLMPSNEKAAREVLGVFNKFQERLETVFRALDPNHMEFMTEAMRLCANMAESLPEAHLKLLPLVRSCCIQIISDSHFGVELRVGIIVLLENMSMTVGQELRTLRVGEALLKLVLESSDPDETATAESVIINLHGSAKCPAVDVLIERNVVREYCAPFLSAALTRGSFRDLDPTLMSSVQLFQVLAQCREYAEVLVKHVEVVDLLLQACKYGDIQTTSDTEGRRLALEALVFLSNFSLWRPRDDFVSEDLPLLMADNSAGIRFTASRLWAVLQQPAVAIGSAVAPLESLARPPKDFFLSHTKQSSKWTCEGFVRDHLWQILEREGFSTFYDRVDLPSLSIDECVTAASHCRVLVVVLDDMAPTPWMQKEIAAALAEHVPIQTIYCEDIFRWSECGKDTWRQKRVPTDIIQGAYALPTIDYNQNAKYLETARAHMLTTLRQVHASTSGGRVT